MESYDRHTPFPATILKRKKVSHPGSTKDTYHITLDLTGSHMDYAPGDAIGIYPENPHDLVQRILVALECTGKEKIQDPKTHHMFSTEEWLRKKANISKVSPALFKQIAMRSTHPFLQGLLDPKNRDEKKNYLALHDVTSFLEHHMQILPSYVELLPCLSPLLPRFYSIASSQKCSPHTVDLLVATFSYPLQNEIRTGIGSEFLTRIAKNESTKILCYLHKNPNFSLPAKEVPILMVGPGTGVAPFRAFLQEREKEGAIGKNWLFFGERNQKYDFYYEESLKKWEQAGFLRLDLAFSRDQEEKVYVQHRLLQHGKEVWDFIQKEAVIYVCGDAKQMAKDVQEAFTTIIQTYGKMSLQEAKEFLKMLRKEKRYLQDVY